MLNGNGEELKGNEDALKAMKRHRRAMLYNCSHSETHEKGVLQMFLALLVKNGIFAYLFLNWLFLL